MPEISRFLGIIIAMYYQEHNHLTSMYAIMNIERLFPLITWRYWMESCLLRSLDLW